MAYNYKSIPRALRLILACIAAVSCAAFLTARLSHSAAISAADQEKEQKKRIWAEQVHAFVRAGLGREVVLAGVGACPDEVWASVNSVTSFIRQRSGLRLDPAITDRLARMEERVLNGKHRRITAQELGALLTGIAMERIQNSSEAEIEQVADGFANIKVIRRVVQSNPPNAHGQPCPADEGARLPDKIMLRSNGQGIMSREDFIKQAKTLRARLQSPVILVTLIGLMRQDAKELITERVDSFADALPGQWNQARRQGLTPVQAFLVVYSAASDDPLWYSNAELRQMMNRSETHLRETTGVAISSEGRAAYGNGGYIFSTPLNLALDQRTTVRILDLIEERSAK